MKKITLQLDINEVNMTLNALQKLPYEQVHLLVAKIHTQATVQLEAKPEEKNDTISSDKK